MSSEAHKDPLSSTGPYEIVAGCGHGEGGMGRIYKVRHRRLNHVRAVKVMKSSIASNPLWRRRFENEARIAAELRHTHIAHLYDYAVGEDGTALMILEWVDGCDLRELVEVLGPLPVPWVLELCEQALSAVGYLHRHEVVHRDIAPDNLMVSHSPEESFELKLVDLGIAKRLSSTEHITKSDQFVGKVLYAPPEAFGSSGSPDPRSDLYSVGAVLYYVLTGKPPFAGEHTYDLVSRILFHPPRPFTETDPDERIPEQLRRVILKALEKRADDRFQQAREMGDALESVRAHLSQDCDADRLSRGIVEASRRRLVVGSAGDFESDEARVNLGFPEGEEPSTTLLERLLGNLGHGKLTSIEEATRPRPGSRSPRSWWPLAVTGLGLAIVAIVLALSSLLPPPVAVDTATTSPPADDPLEPPPAAPAEAGDEPTLDPDPTTDGLAGRSGTLTLVTNDRAMAGRLIEPLRRSGRTVGLASSLDEARASGASHAARLTVEQHRDSTESYGTRISYCQVSATIEILRLADTVPIFAETIDRQEPTCPSAAAIVSRSVEAVLVDAQRTLPRDR